MENTVIRLDYIIESFGVKIKDFHEDLNKLFDQLGTSNNILCIKHNSEHKCNYDKHKKNKKKSKLNQRYFLNCIIIIVKYKNIILNCKIFKNGKIHISYHNKEKLNHKDIIQHIINNTDIGQYLTLECESKIYLQNEHFIVNNPFEIKKFENMIQNHTIQYIKNSAIKIDNILFFSDTILMNCLKTDRNNLLEILTKYYGCKPIIDTEFKKNDIDLIEQDNDIDNNTFDIEI